MRLVVESMFYMCSPFMITTTKGVFTMSYLQHQLLECIMLFAILGLLPIKVTKKGIESLFPRDYSLFRPKPLQLYNFL